MIDLVRAPLMESVETGTVQADRLLAAYHGPWNGSLAPICQASRIC